MQTVTNYGKFMEIKHIIYVKKYSTFDGDCQTVNVEILKKLVILKAEHVNWVGVIDNLFTQATVIYAFIFYDGKWDSKKIVDRLIHDAVEPWSDDDWPTPFSHMLEKINSEREKFVELLKGGKIN